MNAVQRQRRSASPAPPRCRALPLRIQCGRTLSTQGNLNNDIGLPLTLARLGADDRFAVIEMGANHPGEIDYLASNYQALQSM